MKATASLMIIAFFGLIVIEARAQESSIALNVEASSEQLQRTPALIVHEIIKPATSSSGAATPLATKTQGAPAKNAATKLPAGAPSVNPTTPLVVLPPASQTTASELTSSGNAKYDEFIAQAAARNGIDPNLIVAVMRQESGFNSRARSYKGAMGLMQLMPATAQRFGVANAYDAAQNIEGGARYLRFLLDSFGGDVNLALAGYNAGEHAVVNSGFRVPRYRETQNYVRSISARYDANRNSGKRAASSTQSAAPSAAVFAGGKESSRLSNNY